MMGTVSFAFSVIHILASAGIKAPFTKFPAVNHFQYLPPTSDNQLQNRRIIKKHLTHADDRKTPGRKVWVKEKAKNANAIIQFPYKFLIPFNINICLYVGDDRRRDTVCFSLFPDCLCFLKQLEFG